MIGRGGRVITIGQSGHIHPKRAGRLWTVIFVLILIVAVFVSTVGNVGATTFNPPHSDFGEDTDSDGDFNYLVVNVIVNVNVSGNYTIDGSLLDSLGGWIDDDSNTTYLTVGTHTVQLRFEGWLIRISTMNGPYTVELELFDDLWNWIDSDIHTTNNYKATDFELPPAEFSPPHSDYGLDTDGDGLFDYLVVEVEVYVREVGFCNIYGNLFDSVPHWIGDYDNYTFLNSGNQIVQLYFEGMNIYNNGVNGSYTLYLDLEDGLMNWMDSDIYTTNSYTYDQFQPPPALFQQPYSDYGLDTNGDGYFDYLVVNVTVNASVAANYVVEGNLYDGFSNWIDLNTNLTFLNIGPNVVQILFSGADIYQNGENGPYTIELDLYDELGIWLNTKIYTTSFYTYDQFQPPPAVFEPPYSDYGLDTDGDGLFNYLVVNVSVNVRDAGDFMVEGPLYDLSFNLIEFADNFTFLSTGIQVVQLYVRGSLIYNNGVNGSYIVMLELFDGLSNSLDTGMHITGFYNYDQFQPGSPPAPPTGLEASLINGGNDVLLSWIASIDDGNGENDVAGYTVYKSSTGVNGTYSFATWINATGSPSYDWTDTNAGDDDWNDYFYIVRANDTTNNEEQNNIKVGKVVNYLEQGWNLISVPLIQTSTSKEYVLQTIEGNYITLQRYHAGKSRPWLHWHQDKPPHLNDLIDINHKEGYYIDMLTPDYLVVAGKVPTNTQISLKTGWNMIGYPCLENKITSDALTSIAGKYNAVYRFDSTKVRELQVQGSDIMSPGLGYWIHATQNCFWDI